MTRQKRLSLLALAAACLASPLLAQEPPRDLTGAGTLELGDIDAVLGPHRRAFDQSDGRLALKLIIEKGGAVVGCENEVGASLSAAGEALCDHARAQGRFDQLSYLALHYQQATYHFTVRQMKDARGKGTGSFFVSTGYPDSGMTVIFDDYVIPPAAERLKIEDLKTVEMVYPRSALSRAYEARVVVAMSFDENGRVAQCHPVSSTNSTRMIYETCREAYRAYRLANPPDERVFAVATNWKLAD